MSLYKQLWLSISLLMLVSFIGSFVVSSLSAKAYLQEQLYLKNVDNANALALSLSQSDGDPVLIELTLSAQFDVGHYQLIRLTDPEGKIIIERQDDQAIVEAPLWFTRLLPLEAAPGIAQIQKGWQQLGTLTLNSHSRFAYRELYQSSQRLLVYFLLAAIIGGSLGSLVLRIITRPLGDVVKQAQAIGERRFITTQEPSTLEFKAVVSSMNTLSTRIKTMLEQEASRLDQWHKDIRLDRVTGLLNRQPFLSLLSTALERDDASASGTLLIIRLPGLVELNQSLGRAVMDNLLEKYGAALNEINTGNPTVSCGRLNGSDFAILAPGEDNPTALGSLAQQNLLALTDEFNLQLQISLPAAVSLFHAGEPVSVLLSRLDAALLAAQSEPGSALHLAGSNTDQQRTVDNDSDHWNNILDVAFKQQQLSLLSYPVTDLTGSLLHDECLIILDNKTTILSAGQFLPWISRLNRNIDLDQRVTELALEKLKDNDNSVCINLSSTALADDDFLNWLVECLQQQPQAASRLWIEIPEYAAYQQIAGLRKLCQLLRPLNCRVGIEHMGHQLSGIGQLHDIGLDYVKIDAAFIRGIDNNNANQTLVRTLCMIAHSIGLIAIAEGVQQPGEWQALEALGLDGATGPMVTQRLL